MKDTKQRLILAALEVMHHDPNASLASIAEQAGMSSMTIHRHFDNKKTLYIEASVAVIDHATDLLAASRSMHSQPMEQLRYLVEESVISKLNYHYLSFLAEEFDNHKVVKAYDRMVEGFDTLADQLKKDGSMDSDMPTSWVVNMFEGIVGAGFHSLHEGTIAPKTVQELASQSMIRLLAK